MFKYLQTLLMAVLFGVGAYAQNDPPTLKIESKATAISTFKFDDHLNILSINKKKNGTEVLAINDKMEVLWKKEFDSPPLINRFKNHVVLLTGNENDYHIILLDALNGTPLTDKIIRPRSKGDYWEWQSLYTNNGTVLKLALGITIVTKKPQSRLEMKDLTTLSKLEIIDLNEQLDVTGSVKPDVNNTTLINISFNQAGDMFIGWLDGGTLEIDKYAAGKNVLSGKLTTGVPLLKSHIMSAADYIKVVPSSTDANAVFYGLTYENEKNDIEFGLGKFDFKTNQKLFNNQVINKEYLKSAKEKFVPVNKKIDDVNLGRYSDYQLRYMEDVDGTIVAAMSSQSAASSQISNSGLWFMEGALLINGYDGNLGAKFQQFLPSYTEIPNVYLNKGYYHNKSKLYVVGNNKQGVNSKEPTYGVLDAATGKWDKMENLSRKGVRDSPYFDGKTILWYGDRFIIPYLSPEVTLQLNNY